MKKTNHYLFKRTHFALHNTCGFLNSVDAKKSRNYFFRTGFLFVVIVMFFFKRNYDTHSLLSLQIPFFVKLFR